MKLLIPLNIYHMAMLSHACFCLEKDCAALHQGWLLLLHGCDMAVEQAGLWG